MLGRSLGLAVGVRRLAVGRSGLAAGARQRLGAACVQGHQRQRQDQLVFDQIAQIVPRQQREHVILDTVAALRRADETRAEQGDRLAQTLWNGLLSDSKSLASPLAADAPDADAEKARKALTKSLETYRRRLRDFLEGAR